MEPCAPADVRVFATIIEAVKRLRGQRGPLLTIEDDVPLEQRRQRYLARLRQSEQDELREARRLVESAAAAKEAEARARLRSAAAVLDVLETQEDELSLVRPLVRFDGMLLIKLLHHRADRTTGEVSVSQFMSPMDGRISWGNFHQWAWQSVHSTQTPSGMVVQYMRPSGGRTERIFNQRSLDEWLQTMWCVHPLTLHVYATMELVEHALSRTDEVSDTTGGARRVVGWWAQEHRGPCRRPVPPALTIALTIALTTRWPPGDRCSAQVRELFDRYDTDHNGVLSPSEMVAMFGELGLEELGNVTKEDVASFVTVQARGRLALTLSPTLTRSPIPPVPNDPPPLF